MRIVKQLQTFAGSWPARLLSLGLLCLIAVSCSQSSPQPPQDKELIPITGEVLLDGQPASGVVAMFVPKSTVSKKDPTYLKGRIDDEGHFTIGTYTDNDGVPPDEYVLTFVKYDTSKVVIGQKPADLLQGKYANPVSSPHTISVPSGVSSFDIGTIELSMPDAAAE